MSIIIQAPPKRVKRTKAEYQKQYYKTPKGKAALSRAMRLYKLRKEGMSEEEVAKVRSAIATFSELPDESKLCPIFERPMSEIGGHATDHCHKNLIFRGIISQRANSILGLAYDDSTILRRLADYLESHQKSFCQVA
jgi:hypothetical protein